MLFALETIGFLPRPVKKESNIPKLNRDSFLFQTQETTIQSYQLSIKLQGAVHKRR